MDKFFVSMVDAEVPLVFFEREAFSQVAEKGLHRVPPGYGLSYHTQSFQWHGRSKAGTQNYAPTWNSTLRSELKALLLTLECLWKWHLEENPDDVAAKAQLASIQAELQNVPF